MSDRACDRRMSQAMGCFIAMQARRIKVSFDYSTHGAP